MRRIRARLLVADRDGGMTLVEVMVAMFVFAILSTVVLSTLLQVISTNAVSRAQHAAANLAASEIDLAHDTPDLFALVDDSRTESVDGTVFTIERTTAWVNGSGAVAACGAGGATLRYKSVNVTVSWPGPGGATQTVRADTSVDPVERINDPTRGSVLVSVVDAQGNGVQGATVSLAAKVGGAAVAPSLTDAQGCAYFLRVAPGTYDVSIEKSNYIGLFFEAKPLQQNVSVQAAAAASVGFQYDLEARLNARVLPGIGNVRLPSNLPMTFVSSHGVTTAPLTTTTSPVTINSTSSFTMKMHPRVTYRVFAGHFGRDTGAPDCTAADPNAWPEGTVGGIDLAQGVAPDVSADPGASAPVVIAMGRVRIDGTYSSLQARPAPGASGDPTCSAAIVHSFGSVTSGATIALPYGAWYLTNGPSSSVNATVLSRGTYVGGVVTLDPREPR